MKPHRLHIEIALAVLILGLAQAQAQEATPPTKQDCENAMQVVQRAVDGQLDRVQTVQAKLKATDEQIERRVSRIVDYLCTVTDSQKSGTRIIAAKEDVLQGLKNTVDVYARERDTRLAALGRASNRLTEEDLVHDITRLNDRIEKRVQQALAITMSLPAEKDVPQITETYYGDGVTVQANPEYTRNKMMSGRSNQIRKRVSQALQASVQRLENSNRELERNLQSAKTEAEQKFLQDFIKRNRELSQKRRDDVMRILTDTLPATKELDGRAADELVRQIQTDRLEAKKDGNEWMRLKGEWDSERSKLRDEEARLARYKQMLDNWK
jgi:hypothetical protein